MGSAGRPPLEVLVASGLGGFWFSLPADGAGSGVRGARGIGGQHKTDDNHGWKVPLASTAPAVVKLRFGQRRLVAI